MPADRPTGPMLKAGGLWEKTSGAGKRYMVGRLGGVKVVILENRDRQSDDDPTHNLFFAEPSSQSARATSSSRNGARQERPPRQERTSSRPSRSPDAAPDPDLNDPLDDIFAAARQ